jgi:sarcosine oxidase
VPVSRPFDVAVLGLGGMGSAAAYHLAKRGRRVIGLEQHWPAHDRGSSHGRTRIIRLAYAEHPDYVPLLHRAYELWRELEAASGARLLVETGGLMIGSPHRKIVKGALESARAHGLAHRVFTPEEAKRAFPAFRLRPGEVAFLDERAGVLFPEDCVRAHHQLAAHHGAELRFGVKARVLDDLAALPDRPVQIDAGGDRIEAERVVLAAGAWTSTVARGLAPTLEVDRQVVHWFEPRSDAAAFEAGRFPVFIWDLRGEGAKPAGASSFYGIPNVRAEGVKIGFHEARERVEDPDRLRREVAPAEIERVRAILAEALPELDGKHLASSACMYTNTRDEHFAIGLARGGRAVLASPCSGHGFKFASVVGEILADLAIGGSTRHPIGFLGLDRPGLR